MGDLVCQSLFFSSHHGNSCTNIVLLVTFASNKRSEMLQHFLLTRAQTSNDQPGQSQD